jgi:hypothetical protein
MVRSEGCVSLKKKTHTHARTHTHTHTYIYIHTYIYTYIYIYIYIYVHTHTQTYTYKLGNVCLTYHFCRVRCFAPIFWLLFPKTITDVASVWNVLPTFYSRYLGNVEYYKCEHVLKWKVFHFCPILTKIGMCLKILVAIPNIMKTCLVGVAMFHGDGRTDGLTIGLNEATSRISHLLWEHD